MKPVTMETTYLEMGVQCYARLNKVILVVEEAQPPKIFVLHSVEMGF
jgi:hypothetical protein